MNMSISKAPTSIVTFGGKVDEGMPSAWADQHLAKIVRRLRDLPGYELFQYVDEQGEQRSISSTDVNEYLREIAAEDFTAKDFRTWAGTVLAMETVCEFGVGRSQRQAKRNLVRAVERVAERLGNTVAVCRKCFIH